MITPVSTTIEYLIRLISDKESGGTNNRQTMWESEAGYGVNPVEGASELASTQVGRLSPPESDS